MAEVVELQAVLELTVGENEAKKFLDTLTPDNQDRIDCSINADGAVITIRDNKISTISNVIDDILRCFGVFEKMRTE